MFVSVGKVNMEWLEPTCIVHGNRSYFSLCIYVLVFNNYFLLSIGRTISVGNSSLFSWFLLVVTSSLLSVVASMKEYATFVIDIQTD